jgi:hypothetical protein
LVWPLKAIETEGWKFDQTEETKKTD